jgi:hypothetical protein
MDLLALAKQFGNVSQACKMMGCSQDSFHRLKGLHDKGGELISWEIGRKKPMLKNRTAPEIRHSLDPGTGRRTGKGRLTGSARRVRQRVPSLLRHAGHLVGTLKGIGRVYQQTVIDTNPKVEPRRIRV